MLWLLFCVLGCVCLSLYVFLVFGLFTVLGRFCLFVCMFVFQAYAISFSLGEVRGGGIMIRIYHIGFNFSKKKVYQRHFSLKTKAELRFMWDSRIKLKYCIVLGIFFLVNFSR